MQEEMKPEDLGTIHKFANEFKVTFLQVGFVGLTYIVNVNGDRIGKETVWMPLDTFKSLVLLFKNIEKQHKSRIVVPKGGRLN